MSSTRTAKDDSVFHQSRYASSAEFDRGLIANLVAKRCALLDDTESRELVWFIQHLSHQTGGLCAVATDLISKYGHRLMTPAMVEIGAKPGKFFNAEQVKKIRLEMDAANASTFLLKGEAFRRPFGICKVGELKGAFACDDDSHSQSHPASYPVSDFIQTCQKQAKSNLENCLREICLDPKSNLQSGPWYFPGLIVALKEHQASFVESKKNGAVVTALGQKVCEVLDYTFYSRGLTLVDGQARLGKTHAARAWCEQRPGHARFVEVPTGNDEASFFRALARGLGIGNFLQYKVTEIRERVESVLHAGDLLLVLDEAHRLWPQKNLRYGFPSRVNWLMAMANHKVPICAIATPQFIECQKAADEKGQWNSAQLTGRITHYESLPSDLSPDDLIAVAKSALPEANVQVLRALAVYARSSSRYLAAIDSISKRARYIAMCDKRTVATTEDVRKAMQESVIPADTKLHRALESGKKAKMGRLMAAPEIQAATNPAPAEEILPVRSRGNLVAYEARERAGKTASLIEA